jgi:hypothetical protein
MRTNNSRLGGTRYKEQQNAELFFPLNKSIGARGGVPIRNKASNQSWQS